MSKPQKILSEKKGPMSLKDVDITLDELCDLCGNWYCSRCPSKDACPYDCVERCPRIPCLDCKVYEVRKTHGLDVKGTIGRKKK